MNGCGGRWIERLHPLARWHAAGAVRARTALPCSIARSLSYGGCLLTRVTRRKPVSISGNASPEDGARLIKPGKRVQRAPPGERPFIPGPDRSAKEMKDAEGRKYFISGQDRRYCFRHGSSVEGGYVKAEYTARNTFMNPSTKTLEYGRRKRMPLLILYSCNFVEDDEFWDEISVLCDFATSVTEREKDIRGHSPERDSRPIEFIYVKARFHCNTRGPDESWHITVDFGNRKTWNDGAGFFRPRYHIYAKNNDLSKGYAGYCSSILKSALTKNIEPSQSDDKKDGIPFMPLGQKEKYRHPHFRNVLYKATQRTLESLEASQFHKTNDWMFRKCPNIGTLERVTHTSIQDQLNNLLSSICEGALRPAEPTKRIGPHVVDYSGDLVPVREAIMKAKSEGKHVPPAWEVILRNYNAELARISRKPYRYPGSFQATRTGRDNTGRTPVTPRPKASLQQRSLRSEGLDGSEESSTQKPNPHGRLEEGLSIRQEHLGADEGPSARRQTKGSARPRTKQDQPTSSGEVLSESNGPDSGGSDVSPRGSSFRDRQLRARALASDARKTGKNMGSPLPPSAADLSWQGAKTMRSSYGARGAKKARASNAPPAWALPRDAKQDTPGEVRP